MTRRWWKWGISLLVVATLAFGLVRTIAARKAQQAAVAAQAAQRAEAPLELAASDLVQVRTRTLSQGLAISGSLKAANAVVIKARVAGELQGFSLREGDTVRAGQVIGRIDATDAQARVRQAQQQAESAKAQVDMAQRTFDNNNALVVQGFISKSSLDTSTSSLAAAQANYRAAQAGADMATKALQDTVLRSPITGQVAQRLAQNGERMAIDGRVVEIVDLTRIELEASLSPADSLRVQLGQVAEVRVEGASKPLRAKVVRINPSAVAGSRAVLAYLELEPDEKTPGRSQVFSHPLGGPGEARAGGALAGLRQGLFAQGSLQTGSTEAPVVPLSAVRTDKPAPYVQLVRDNRVVHQIVTLGERGQADGQAMVAVTGVPQNTSVISGSVGALREGTAIKVTAAIASAPAASTSASAK